MSTDTTAATEATSTKTNEGMTTEELRARLDTLRPVIDASVVALAATDPRATIVVTFVEEALDGGVGGALARYLNNNDANGIRGAEILAGDVLIFGYHRADFAPMAEVLSQNIEGFGEAHARCQGVLLLGVGASSVCVIGITHAPADAPPPIAWSPAEQGAK